jgi:NitT/TauT family transport system substrate-binding protein
MVRIVADTRTFAGTQAVYGGPYPGGVVYTTPAIIERNPAAVFDASVANATIDLSKTLVTQFVDKAQ